MQSEPDQKTPTTEPVAAKPSAPKPVERLFPFVLRARLLLVGRDVLARSKRNLHFVLLTTDISETSRDAVLSEYQHYPVVQHFTSADLDTFFQLKGTKLVGFKKSSLAQSIYGELKQYRLNPPAKPGVGQETPPPK